MTNFYKVYTSYFSIFESKFNFIAKVHWYQGQMNYYPRKGSNKTYQSVSCQLMQSSTYQMMPGSFMSECPEYFMTISDDRRLLMSDPV